MRCALQLLQCSASKFWSAIAAVKQSLYICKGFLRLLYCHNFCTQKMETLIAFFVCLFVFYHIYEDYILFWKQSALNKKKQTNEPFANGTEGEWNQTAGFWNKTVFFKTKCGESLFPVSTCFGNIVPYSETPLPSSILWYIELYGQTSSEWQISRLVYSAKNCFSQSRIGFGIMLDN